MFQLFRVCEIDQKRFLLLENSYLIIFFEHSATVCGRCGDIDKGHGSELCKEEYSFCLDMAVEFLT